MPFLLHILYFNPNFVLKMQFSVNYTVVFFIFQAKIHLYKNIFDKNSRFSLDKSQFLAYYIFIMKAERDKTLRYAAPERAALAASGLQYRFCYHPFYGARRKWRVGLCPLSQTRVKSLSGTVLSKAPHCSLCNEVLFLIERKKKS